MEIDEALDKVIDSIGVTKNIGDALCNSKAREYAELLAKAAGILSDAKAQEEIKRAGVTRPIS